MPKCLFTITQRGHTCEHTIRAEFSIDPFLTKLLRAYIDYFILLLSLACRKGQAETVDNIFGFGLDYIMHHVSNDLGRACIVGMNIFRRPMATSLITIFRACRTIIWSKQPPTFSALSKSIQTSTNEKKRRCRCSSL